MIHLPALLLAGCCFALSAWRSDAPEWNRIVSVGLTLLVISMVSW